MVMQMQVAYYTEQLLSFEYQLLQLRRSIRNILFAYKTTKVLDNKNVYSF